MLVDSVNLRLKQSHPLLWTRRGKGLELGGHIVTTKSLKVKPPWRGAELRDTESQHELSPQIQPFLKLTQPLDFPLTCFNKSLSQLKKKKKKKSSSLFTVTCNKAICPYNHYYEAQRPAYFLINKIVFGRILLGHLFVWSGKPSIKYKDCIEVQQLQLLPQ